MWADAVREAAIASRGAGTDQAIVDAIAHVRPASVIDIGCGEGWLTRRIRREFACEAMGIDASATLIGHAREADPAGHYAVLGYHQLADLPARMTGPFDSAVCNFSLLDEDVNSTLIAICDLLTDSGVLIIQTLHPWVSATNRAYQDGWTEETFASLSSSGWAPMPWYFRTLESWVRQVDAAGMVLQSIHEPIDSSSAHPMSMILVCGKHTLHHRQP